MATTAQVGLRDALIATVTLEHVKLTRKKNKEGWRKGSQETKSDNATSALRVNGYEHVREDLFTLRPNERTVLKPYYITYMFLCQICTICNLSSTT